MPWADALADGVTAVADLEIAHGHVAHAIVKLVDAERAPLGQGVLSVALPWSAAAPAPPPTPAPFASISPLGRVRRPAARRGVDALGRAARRRRLARLAPRRRPAARRRRRRRGRGRPRRVVDDGGDGGGRTRGEQGVGPALAARAARSTRGACRWACAAARATRRPSDAGETSHARGGSARISLCALITATSPS